MARKTKNVTPPPPPAPVLEWDPDNKEVWHCNFEKELINDEKWTCIVTAAVQSEARDEECITTYTQSVKTGNRKAVKIITMADIIKLLREHGAIKGKKENENPKTAKTDRPRMSVYTPPSRRSSQMVELASKYATLTDTECQLPPDLMAGLLKFLILKLKEESCFQKRVEAVRAKKFRQQSIREKFIREKKPFEAKEEEFKPFTYSRSVSEVEEPINDEPLGGPDLYIMLVDFYDVFYFPEMLRVNIPLVALLKISTTQGKDPFDNITPPKVGETYTRKSTYIISFWERLKEECIELGKTSAFKDIAMMQYFAPIPRPSSKQYCRTVFDELTWMQYSAHCIYRQHQKYLQEMEVQPVFISLEPLDLSKCTVYNKLCDALITGEPLTPLMVLYAIVEQVVVGIQETESVPLVYHPKPPQFVPRMRRRTLKKKKVKVGPASVSEQKDPAGSLNDKQTESSLFGTIDGSFYSLEALECRLRGSSCTTLMERLEEGSDIQVTDSLLDQVISERKTEKELKADKKWKTPILCSHGDSIFRQTFYCDPRLFDAEAVVRRFLRNSDFFQIWRKYPELPPEEKVYYNYHFFKLWKISGGREDLLKLKIFFCLAMKLIGITKSYLYKGDEENVSASLSEQAKDKPKFTSRSKLERNPFPSFRGEGDSFSNYFFKTFIVEMYYGVPRKAVVDIHNKDWRGSSSFKTDSQLLLMKITSHLNVFLMSRRSSRTSFPYWYKSSVNKSSKSLPFHENQEKVYQTLSFLLECLEISNLTEAHFVSNNEDYVNIIKSYKFYEKLDTNLMTQRVLEAGGNFNTIQCWHFMPTDSLVIIMHDDYDHRGVFHTTNYGTLPTPVALRDFYNYVYPEISDWLVNENAEHWKFVAKLAEKLKEEEEQEDAEYLAQLNRDYDKMSPEKRQAFLEEIEYFRVDQEIVEKELGTLPKKQNISRPKTVSFVGTNLSDLRVENNKKVDEFHSRDGTKVHVTVDSWLYNPYSLLKLEVRRSDFLLYYNQWLGREVNTSFTFKTISGIIFSFYKDSELGTHARYEVTISWPTGLIIRPIWIGTTLYIKQNYLKPCRAGWKIEDEDSRCFLRNGQIIVFKSNGDFDVLCSSGTKYCFYDSATTPRYEVVSTTGEVWEIRTKGPCRNRKKLLSRYKLFLGVDPTTQESFYKREDGTQCMLWSSGRLVTTYPDGTKLTSTPCFDEEEIYVNWTEDERLYFEQLAHNRYKSEQSVQEPRSRTILRHSSGSKTADAKPIEFEGFVSVSCACLMEHPKYSTVFVSPGNPFIKVTLPEYLSIVIHPKGNYEVQQDKNFLRVQKNGAQFQTVCYSCNDTSTVKLNLDSDDILCSFVDFFHKGFFTLRNGEIKVKEFQESESEKIIDDRTESQYNLEPLLCTNGHTKSAAHNQRCFALERDLSGVEFLHQEYVALHASKLPVGTYYEHSENEPNDNSHTFSSHYCTAGYEKWVMNYEEPLNSLPVNIKKKDLKELGAKQVSKNLFQYPFPKNHNCTYQPPKEKIRKNINSPKLIVNRTILCLSAQPDSVITEVKKYVTAYQQQAMKIYKAYAEKKCEGDHLQKARHIETRLRKIASTLCKNSQVYPHLGTQLPSTEQDIHYFGHFINKMQELKSHVQDCMSLLPNCKNIPVPLPRISNLPTIEEVESSPED